MFADKEMQLRTETVRHIRGQENARHSVHSPYVGGEYSLTRSTISSKRVLSYLKGNGSKRVLSY